MMGCNKIKSAIIAASGRKSGPAVAGFMGVHEWIDQRGVSTPLRLAHLFGQCAHESTGFTRTIEGLSYTPQRLMAVWPGRFFTLFKADQFARQPKKLANFVYANRMGNGSPESGDGWLYRGRGWLQLTGRNQYRAAGLALGLDLEADPNLAREPDTAWKIAAHYLATRKRRGKTALEWADEDNIRQVTRIVNGGLNGLDDRARRTASALNALGDCA